MTPEKKKYPVLASHLDVSLFSRFSLMDGFSDKKALDTIEILNKYLQNISPEGSIPQIIDKILIESIGRSVGHGENHGSGFPFDLTDLLQHQFSSDINEGLICDTMEWAFGIKTYDLVTVTKNKEESYYFQSNHDTNELIQYNTFSKIAFNALNAAFSEEYRLICRIILKEIPAAAWNSLIEEDETIENYL